MIARLHEIKALEFGDFTLKSGMKSPFYLDLRKVVSYPDLLKSICEELYELSEDIAYDHLCGVPYAALGFAAGMAVMYEKPMLLKRKERKSYGTKKMIEGVYAPGDICLVVEDTLTSGMSLIETNTQLRKSGLVVEHALVIIDREQGGREVLEGDDCSLHALFTITEAMDSLFQQGLVTAEMREDVLNFVRANKVVANTADTEALKAKPNLRLSYGERIALCQNPVSKRLLRIAESKQSNLIASADVATLDELLKLADEVGPHICALKTHVDILDRFTPADGQRLRSLADKHDFLLFEDRKFGDIGNTLRLQVRGGQLGIDKWADFVTTHVVGGAASVEALNEAAPNLGLVLIAQMSTKDTLTDENYTTAAMKIATNYPKVVMGVVAQKRRLDDPASLQFTPGVNLDVKGDGKGQVYNTPSIAFNEKGADFIIVGRGIYKADSPLAAAIKYKEEGWLAYSSTLSVLA